MGNLTYSSSIDLGIPQTPETSDPDLYEELLTIYQALRAVAIQVSSSQLSGLTIASGGQLIVAHGLGRMPTKVSARLVCLAAEYGYSIGDVLVISPNSGMAIVIDAANVTIRYNTNASCFSGYNKATGAAVSFTNANWSLSLGISI